MKEKNCTKYRSNTTRMRFAVISRQKNLQTYTDWNLALLYCFFTVKLQTQTPSFYTRRRIDPTCIETLSTCHIKRFCT